jgi:predicted ferric reductase
VATSEASGISPSYNTAIRIFALYTLTIVFLNIMTGSFRPLLVRVFKARTMLRFHNTTGVVGFSMALTHGILVIIYGLWPGFSKLGPVALYILAVTTFTVLFRKFLKKSWRWIHRLNYVVFVVALIHAFQVGSDVAYGGTFLRVMLYVYTSLVAVGFVYRSQLAVRLYIRRKRKSKTATV